MGLKINKIYDSYVKLLADPTTFRYKRWTLKTFHFSTRITRLRSSFFPVLWRICDNSWGRIKKMGGGAHAMKRIPRIKFPQRHPKSSVSGSMLIPFLGLNYFSFFCILPVLCIKIFCFSWFDARMKFQIFMLGLGNFDGNRSS